MWPKSTAAIFGGCLVSISIMLNLNYILPTAVDTRLFIGLLCAFPLWITMMVWCYVSEGGLQAWKRCGSVLLVSIGINAIFVLG
ncbi:hypothetical protein [Pseudoalteromonas denitrificans]|jgi:hypothetical protein|uniref:Uncharacterized protein n=1 Tax=Pseudoalteromonas denitrificans DSM 6059 TaxID=1123010 RepID=A0A1I1KJH5_9GAMM|nr:hypothetical protein [Pseudoalteromonas denitrificans]SFC60919.1 hypothetical protein SAMN02745724_02086 [Pseudoalteromonas denitrificans DSM 6059]